jgi:purine-binding chemotaxis protein CheW
MSMAEPPNPLPPEMEQAQACEPIPPEAGPEPEVEGEQAGIAAEPLPPEEQYCIFRAGRERFCLHVLETEEVVEWPRLTKLPLSPPFLMGVFNLRGTIVPVVDIAFTEVRRGDLPPKLVVVACLRSGDSAPGVRIGIAADEVIGTHSTREPLLRDEAPRGLPHCAGLLRHGERLALALDLKRVLETFPVGVI